MTPQKSASGSATLANMSSLNSLRSMAELGDLAKALQFSPSGLSYVLFKLPEAKKYKTFEIPKRNGGKRTIKAPVDALKLIQRNLSTLLQDCIDEINAAKGRKDRIAHGFKRKRSIMTNAKEHHSRRFVFNVDLEDFFPSINFGRVRGFFIKNNSFALHQRVATVIAQIACQDNALPQGSPCSPVISNLIAHVLDMHLVRLASSVGCTYSRYADDLTFSTNKKIFPAEIAELSKTEPHHWTPGGELMRLIARSGFRINSSKTHMQYRASRQEVTGLVVNRKISVRHEYRHNVRAMVHSLLNTGSFNLYALSSGPGMPSLTKQEGTVNQLHGMLAFVDTVDLYYRRLVGEPQDSRLSSKELMYQRFLIYKHFFAGEVPVILCEGETDNVYLTHAIRSLARSYPQLATTNPAGKISLSIRLYKYRKSSTPRILGLHDGGTANLAKFIAIYKKETAKFKAPGQKQPVIILYDNDSGAKPIISAVSQASGKKLDTKQPFAHVIRNLYAVPTPLLNGATESKIEDFFEPSLKDTAILGKKFDDTNDFDTDTCYGKKVFAYKVVRPNADSINFDGFRPLLTNLVSAIESNVP